MIAGGPKPVAPFSHAVETDGFVFVTGQMPDRPEMPEILPDGIESQTKAVMENLKVVLAGVGLGLEHVVIERARDENLLKALQIKRNREGVTTCVKCAARRWTNCRRVLPAMWAICGSGTSVA